MAGIETNDKTKAAPQAADASHKALAEVHEVPKKPDAPVKPTEVHETAKPGDKPATPQDAVFKPAVESVGHLKNARQASDEIVALGKAHTNPQDKITVPGANGTTREITVDDRVKELKKQVQTELISSLKSADSINPGALAQLVRENASERSQIAAKYGVGLADGSTPEQQMVLMQQRTKAMAASDPQASADLERYTNLQKQADSFRKAESLPAASRMLFSEYLSAGLANPKYGLDRVDGKMKVDVTDVQLAATLAVQAGRNPEMRANSEYQKTLAALGDHLGTGDKGEMMLKNIADAHKPGVTAEQKEELLRKAVEASDTIGLRTLAGLRRDPDFMAQQPQDVQMRLAATVDGAAAARLEYMRLLVDKGRVGDAEVLMAKAKNDDPDSVGTMRDGRVTYSSAEWQDLDNRLVRGVATNPADFHKLEDLYNEKVRKGQFTSINDGTRADYNAVLNSTDNANIGADKVLEAMQALNRKQTEERAATGTRLDQEKQSLQSQIDKLPQKQYADDLSRDLEKAELEDKLRAVERAKQDFDKVGKSLLDGEDSERQLLSLNRHLGMNERSSALADLEALKKDHPDIYANIPDEQKKQLDDLTKEIPWYKDWKLYAVAGAAVVGAVVGFGVASWATGPAAAAGVATVLGVSAGTAAVITGAAGTTAGFLAAGAAGGVTYWGAHKTADAFNLSRPDERADDNWKLWENQDFKRGFAIGSISGSMSSAAIVYKGLGMTGTLVAGAEKQGLAEGAAAALAESTAASTAARTTMMSSLMPKLAQTARFMPSSFAMAATQEGTNHWMYGTKFDMASSAQSIAVNTGFGAFFGGGKYKELSMLKTSLTSAFAAQGMTGAMEYIPAMQQGSDYNYNQTNSVFGPRAMREYGFSWLNVSNDPGNGLRQLQYNVFGTPNEGPSARSLDRIAGIVTPADTDGSYTREQQILNNYKPLGPGR